MSRLTLPELRDVAARYRAYFDALRGCFVGRDEIVTTLSYAMAQRQHVLIFGPPGTSKTQLCDVAFGGIEGANKFVVELSMYMGEDAIYGPYDTSRMRQDGVLEHRIEGMLPEADIARIGEFLDGNMALLRSLLGALHERRMRRGRQIVDMPLLTVYADTNCHPGDFLKKNPYAWAVLDRLLFMSDLTYLSTANDISEMLYRFQSGQTTRLEAHLSLDDIRAMSELVVEPPSLIQDRLLILKLGEAFVDYRLRRAEAVKAGTIKPVLPEISDRRLCFATQMLEVAAVLDGRIEVRPADMETCGLVLGTTDEEYALWREIAQQKTAEVEHERTLRLQHAQIVAIDGIIERSRQIGSGNDVQAEIQTLRTFEQQLNDIVPENDDVDERKAEAIEELANIRRSLQQRVLDEAGIGS